MWGRGTNQFMILKKEQLLEANRRKKWNAVKKETRVRNGQPSVWEYSQVLKMGLGE